MGHLLAAVQRKGGCGKTTTVINIAAELAFRGYSVLVVDADPQASASAWAEPRRLPFTVARRPLQDGHAREWIRAIRALVRTVDFVLVDAPPHIDDAVGAALAISDLALMPCGASDLDLAGLKQTLRLACAVRHIHGLSVVLVPVKVDARTLEGQDLTSALAEFGEHVAPKLGDYAAFKRSFSTGLSVRDFDPASKANEDVATLTTFLLDLVGAAPPLVEAAPLPSFSQLRAAVGEN